MKPKVNFYTNTDLYHNDFNLSIYNQITLLKAGKTGEIDIEHLIDELEDISKSNLRELNSHLKILITHLLKWQFQLATLQTQWEEYEEKSWRLTIIEQRSQLIDLLEDIPSLRRTLPNVVKNVYPKAVILAVEETGLSKSTFPPLCPYTVEQLLDKQFYPEPV
jgi:hypothetical protein